MPPLIRLAALLLCLAALQACAGTSSAPPSPSSGLKGTSRPYSVNGKTYYPLLTADGYRETGIASWYGGDFHGRRTASGEIYDMYKVSAAHKLLPMNTIVRVTNLRNNRSLEVRINDRGPFVADRSIDLSYGAATLLGITGRGTVPVLIESVGAIPGATGGDLPGTFYVQVGAFEVQSNADNLIRRLQNKEGYPGSRQVDSVIGGRTLHRVQAGTFSSLARAREAHGQLLRAYPQAFIVAE